MATIKKTGPGVLKKGGLVKAQDGGIQKGVRMSPTGRKTAMTALGVKKQSNEFSPSRFSENVNATTSNRPKPASSRKMQKGGFVSKANAWLDKYFRDPINKAADENLRKPASKLASNINKAADKSFRDPINKAGQKLNKYLQKNISGPINDSVYNKKRKAVVKKVVTVKPKKGSEKRG